MSNERARELRKRLTPQEVKLWVKLRGLRPLGFYFRRQAPIGLFIVDFVCFQHHVIVEADGGQHGYAQHLHEMPGVINFWNRRVFAFSDSGVLRSTIL